MKIHMKIQYFFGLRLRFSYEFHKNFFSYEFHMKIGPLFYTIARNLIYYIYII